jgi:hypothetical protein
VEESPEFIKLKEECDSYVKTIRTGRKFRIAQTTKLEVKIMETEMKEEFVKAVKVICEAFLIGEDMKGKTTANRVVSEIMEGNHEALLKHTKITDFNAFCAHYKRIHGILTFPCHRATVNAVVNVYAGGSQSQSQSMTQNDNRMEDIIADNTQPTQPTQPVQTVEMDKIKRVIEAVLVSAIDTYEERVKKNDIDLTLKKLSIQHFTTQATEATQMELDSEPAADRHQLQQLIQKETEKETKKLKRELEKLHDQVKTLKSSSKNSARGQSTGASKKKEMQQVQQQQPSQSSKSKKKKSGKEKAEEPNNATGDGRKQRKGKRGKRNGREKQRS